jgi:large subunit ribosomal protein L18e
MKNDQLQRLIKDMKELSAKQEGDFWRRIALDLEKPTRKRRMVNVYKIDKVAQENETVIVPGKVLGTGDLNKSVKVAAYQFSQDAIRKINEKGETLTIEELMTKNPSGKGVRILG